MHAYIHIHIQTSGTSLAAHTPGSRALFRQRLNFILRRKLHFV